jgi:hypothetical protein
MVKNHFMYSKFLKENDLSYNIFDRLVDKKGHHYHLKIQNIYI